MANLEFRKKRRGSEGFSLVELLVTILITMMLSGLVITYSSFGRAQIALYVEQAKIAQAISRAKSLAIASYASPQKNICGYGFHIDYENRQYAIFEYAVSNCSGILNIDSGQSQYYKEIEKYTLNSNLDFIVNEGESLKDVLFLPPDPQTKIWKIDEAMPSSFGKIKIKTADGSATAEVGVTTAGQVSFR